MILTIRGQKVILDRDLAALYGVPTSRFNEAVKRNRRRFPDDFMFQLTRHEITDLISQKAISSSGHGGLRKLPRAFTEHGAFMAANVMHSKRAIQLNVRLDRHKAAIVNVLRQIMSLLNPPSKPEPPCHGRDCQKSRGMHNRGHQGH